MKMILNGLIQNVHKCIVLKFLLDAKHDRIKQNKGVVTMENQPVPPVIPHQEPKHQEQTEKKQPHPRIPESKKDKPQGFKSADPFEMKTILALVLGIAALILTMLSAFTGFFNFLAVVAGIAAVVLALISLELTKPKVVALVVSVVGLAIAVTIAGTALFTAARFSWSLNHAFQNDYSYDYGNRFWNDNDDFWD